ncbi:MAG: acetylglutamate kinase, partial [Lentisphaerae bacterium]|nr:acetylglutamate kinase [Lentisphaerota bacterium]
MNNLTELISKASVLMEALPYIQKFRDKIVVIKFGGSAMESLECQESILASAAFMDCVGMLPVIVHGGGKRISNRLAEDKIKPVFIKGLRVTDEKTIKVVDDVLANVINPGIVDSLRKKGSNAIGIRGQTVMTAEKRFEVNEKGEPVDLGFVGNIISVDTKSIKAALADKVIPVITPLATGTGDELFNINADDAAAAIATALSSKKLVFLSDVPGILRDADDPESVLTTLKTSDVDELMKKGVIDGGMLPKVKGAVKALEAGVSKVHII